jgi:hypothetical protein
MKTISLANVIGFLIDDCGFDASGVARTALTHETNTEVTPTVKVTAPKKTRPNRSAMPRAPRGSMQPGGVIFEEICKVIYSFDGFTTVSDISKVSQHPECRVTKVTSNLQNRGLLRREGLKLALTS